MNLTTSWAVPQPDIDKAMATFPPLRYLAGHRSRDEPIVMTFHAQLPTTTRAAEGLPRRRFTVADVEAMVAAGIMEEDERVELIGGELVPMAAKGIRHEVLKGELLDRWYKARPDSLMLIPETTFRLSEDTYLEPDVVIYDRVAGLKSLSGDSVLLVVEIADSSLRYDIGRKAELYASFGVRELWVIDAVAESIHVFSDPSADGYGSTQAFSAADRVTPRIAPDAFALRLDELDI